MTDVSILQAFLLDFILSIFSLFQAHSFLGCFHLVGAIFTTWGKIYHYEGNMKWAAFRTVNGNVFRETVTLWFFFFELSHNFPQNEKTQKLVINGNF